MSPRIVGAILGRPGGRWIVARAAICTPGAGINCVAKGWRATSRETLAASTFPRNHDRAPRAGVIASGVLIVIVAGFLPAAAGHGNPDGAIGLGKAFGWLSSQPSGNVPVATVCLGLTGFAFVCLVNAAYRIIPKAPHIDIESFAHRSRAAT